MPNRTSYSISIYPRGYAFSVVWRLSDRVAGWLARNLWRLGPWRWQVEQNVFGTSYIETHGEPATRAPDIWSVPWDRHGAFSIGVHNAPPEARRVEVGGTEMLLRESSVTNLALHSADAGAWRMWLTWPLVGAIWIVPNYRRIVHRTLWRYFHA